MLNGMEFKTVGPAYADRRVLEGVLRLMKGERYAGEPV